jgi:hypothetical protein
MPIYRYKCSDCDREQDEYRKIDDRDDAPFCKSETCLIPVDTADGLLGYEVLNIGSYRQMHRVVTAPYVAADMAPYQSMIDGSWITSRSRHNEHLKAHGCIEIGNEMHHMKAKQKPELSKESRAARKQTLIEQVNALK